MHRRGEKHPKATLSDNQVREIRSQHMAYIPAFGYRALAEKYGVGKSTIRDIVTFRTRKNA